MGEKTIGLKPENTMEAKAECADHIMNHHMVAAAEGGRHHVVKGGRRPPHIMWSGSIFSIGLRMFSQLLPPLFFQHFAPIVLLGRLGPK